MQKILGFIVILFFLQLFVLIQVGSYFGGFNTLLAVFFTTFVGVVLLKSRFKVLLSQLQSGVFDIQLTFLPLAGFLFLFPGFISDILALLLLVPSVQIRFQNYYSQKQSKPSDGYTKGQTIDGEFTEIRPEDENEKLK